MEVWSGTNAARFGISVVETRKAPIKGAWPILYQDSRMERGASSTGAVIEGATLCTPSADGGRPRRPLSSRKDASTIQPAPRLRRGVARTCGASVGQPTPITDVQARPVELWLNSLALAPKSRGHVRGCLVSFGITGCGAVTCPHNATRCNW